MGRIYRSESNGDKWEEVLLEFDYVRNFVQDNRGYLYLSSELSGIMKSEDDGLTWTRFTQGLPTSVVNNLIGDQEGRLFCSLTNDETDVHGGLFYWDESQNQWVKKEIHVNVQGENFIIRVSAIRAMSFTPDGEMIISLNGVASNFEVAGLFRNSTPGAIDMNVWKSESWSDSTQIPFTLSLDGIFTTTTGNIFASRVSSTSAGIYAKMGYSKKWILSNEGIPSIGGVKGHFCETPDGAVYLVTDFFNKVFVTKESVLGKKYFKINYVPLKAMKVYQHQTITATSGASEKVKFKSLDNRTSIEGNDLRAIGLGNTMIKAFIDGNDSTYYSEERISLSIAKAENKIQIEHPGILYESDSTVSLKAYATSGEEVLFKVIRGEAHFIKNSLKYSRAGRITFIATEQGNGTYEVADTVRMELCITPVTPTLAVDDSSGPLRLISSSDSHNRWYVDHEFTGETGKVVYPRAAGMYTVQVEVDECISEGSKPYHHVVTGITPASQEAYSVFPIPSKQELIIRNSDAILKTSYCLTDLTGKIILNNEYEGNQATLDLATLSPGVYVLRVTNNQKSAFFKIIKN